MDLLSPLFSPQSVAWSVFVIMLVAAGGLALGNIKAGGINLGIAGVLFSGILFGHFGLAINHETLEFLRDFGLILFVYSIGTQVGPGFFSSFKKQGLRLNLLAAAVVLGGVAVTLAVARLAGFDIATAVGMYAGAVTNTPSLAAAQQSLAAVSPEAADGASVGYALAYPGAILGIILTMLLIRRLFKAEAARDMLEMHADKAASSLINASIAVENKNLDGLMIKDIPAIAELGVVVSRVYHDGQLAVAHDDTLVHAGDVILAVGPEEKVRKFTLVVGSRSETDLKKLPSRIIHSRVIVTHKEVIGKTLDEINLESQYDVVATRAARADVEFLVSDSYVLQFADNLVIVGEADAIAKAAALLGNSPKDLNHPQLIPAFIGIAAGVLLGSLPITIPGLSAPVKLGLAGGPLIMAIVLSYIQHIGPLNWYLPPAGNLMLRELGITLFLACVGLKAGGRFFETLLNGNGVYIVLFSFLITVLPILIVGIFAKAKLKLNYMSLCGALAGSMTDPPALAFANAMSPSNLSAMSYATVYPLVMILRVISAQVMVLLFIA
ncbi:MAG TPA: putative transporter [Elusimicrobia bacterium]|nr:putative transporter [Elusimicrobiota bacterium]